jgi:hypothetical protein
MALCSYQISLRLSIGGGGGDTHGYGDITNASIFLYEIRKLG